jgi:hypothetical protein
MIPKFSFSTKSTQLDHGQSKIETIMFSALYNLLVEFKVGIYCGAFSESSQPLFPMGQKHLFSFGQSSWEDVMHG